MRSVVLLSALVLGAFHAFAQADQRIAERHARISELYDAENYTATIEAIDLQLKEVPGTTWQDSIHLYVYKYGRAKWKVKGAAAGTAAAEALYATLLAQGIQPAQHMDVLSDLSWLYYDLGEMKACLRVDSMALAEAQRNSDVGSSKLAHAHQNVAFDHAIMAHHTEALKSYLAAKVIYERSPVPAYLDLSECCNGAGVSSWHLGRTHDAEHYYREALTNLERSDAPNVVVRKAGILSNIGIMWQDAGDIARSKLSYQEGVRMCTEAMSSTSDPTVRDAAVLSRSKAYVNLATVYFSMGDNAHSQELLDLAYRDRSSILEPGDARILGIRERMADIAMETGDLARAETDIVDYMKACATHYGTHNEEYFRASTKLAEVYAGQGRVQEAAAMFERTIAEQKAAPQASMDPQLAVAFRRRSRFFLDQGKVQEALDDLQAARSIMSQVHGDGHYKVAQYEVLLAEAALADDDATTALRWSTSALERLDDRAEALGGNALPRAFPQPQLLTDALLWKVKAERALSNGTALDPDWSTDLDLAIRSLDRNRAAIDDEGSQLGLVGEQKVLFDLAIDLAYETYAQSGKLSDIDRFLALMEADRSILLKSRLNEFTSLRFAGVPDSILIRERALIQAMEVDPDNEQALDLTLNAEREYAVFLERLSERYPRYFDLRYGTTTIDVEDVRKKLLGPDRDLLAYAITSDHLYMLVIRMDTAAIVRVKNSEVADATRALNDAINSRDRAAYSTAGHRAYTLFFAPVAPLLTGHELLVIPDGPLHTINFETLLEDPSSTDLVANSLIQRYAFAYLLSATTAVQFANMVRDRSRGVLALAPGFTKPMKQRYLAGLADTSAADHEFLNYVRQPFAVNTARSLGRTLNATILVDGDADERNFRERAERSGVIHLGTHAEMNTIAPMYSRLVLSKGDTSDNEFDGYLHAYEIYELDLRAQLAVLSACRTGTGKNDEGEGVRSLGYGFAYAGCPSLVMSLWSIDEKVSAEIIEGFYHHLAAGMPKHLALRQAKLDHLEHARDELDLPYYWAGLVLVGDVSPVQLDSGWQGYAWWVGIALFLILSVLIWRSRRR